MAPPSRPSNGESLPSGDTTFIVLKDVAFQGPPPNYLTPEQEIDLPKPSFRPANNTDYKERTATAKKKGYFYYARGKLKKDSYFHYIEPNQQELADRVEYDMDLEDFEWLKGANKKYGRSGYSISEDDFEKVMDRLEKESYFAFQRSSDDGAPAVDEDAVCAICENGDSHNSNVILFCDMCDVAVHQECYGVPYIPEGPWLCRRCLKSPLRNVDCVLCPNKGGAFKQTEDQRWAHVVCALWIPEVSFANTVFLEPIDGIDTISKDRLKLSCYICKQKTPACIQCDERTCWTAYHVTCAQQVKLYMKIRDHEYTNPDGSTYWDVKRESFCDVHTPKTHKVNGSMYSDDDDDDEQLSGAERDKRSQKRAYEAREKVIKKMEKNLSTFPELTIDKSKLYHISKLITLRGKSKLSPTATEKLRDKFFRYIFGYWKMKRDERHGVPILRRLQVNYYNAANQTHSTGDIPKDNYTKLRYDLEKCRMLIGHVKRRELIKKKALQLSSKIIEARLDIIDQEDPPTE